MHYFKLQKLEFKQLIDDIIIDLWLPRNFASMKNIRRWCNLIVDLSKFTSNYKLLVGITLLKITLGVTLSNVIPLNKIGQNFDIKNNSLT